ncbi:hypothetical protein BDP55DRAFT_636282 [Colletotrichum godetiae]|uniref:Uncharacterized protein n=1 Tax=Colletotrichum godetiae TaxID=1209918 RepID=A0AAJ0ACU6_9PEZI|nr:uncharacterized protein BDP55DRAFT_636282 [Colletotrichum godetiae]KAK1660128.1 hypothetical protein BDP55DRAFT_636282 [Colletotrichum godetiae]
MVRYELPYHVYITRYAAEDRSWPLTERERAPRQVTKLFATRGSVRGAEARVGSDINPHSRTSQELQPFERNKTEIVAAMRSTISILSIRYDADALVSMGVLPKGLRRKEHVPHLGNKPSIKSRLGLARCRVGGLSQRHEPVSLFKTEIEQPRRRGINNSENGGQKDASAAQTLASNERAFGGWRVDHRR